MELDAAEVERFLLLLLLIDEEEELEALPIVEVEINGYVAEEAATLRS